MSVITDMVIYSSLGNDEAMARVNAWCAERDTRRQQQFAPLDVDAAGGNKVFTGQVWSMSGNYPSFGWHHPDGRCLSGSAATW